MGILESVKMEPKIQSDESIVKFVKNTDESIKDGSEENVKVKVNEIESTNKSEAISKGADSVSETKVQLSFSVDRLLNDVQNNGSKEHVNLNVDFEKCFDQQSFSCCTHPSCLIKKPPESILSKPYQISSLISSEPVGKLYQNSTVPSSLIPFSDYSSKCIVRPLPMRALNGNNCDNVPHCLQFPTLSTTTTATLYRLHQQQQKPTFPHPNGISFTPTTPATNLSLSPLLVTPLTCNLKSLQLNSHTSQAQLTQHQQHFQQSPTLPNHFPKTKLLANTIDIPTISGGHYHTTLHQLQQQQQQLQHQPILTHLQLGNNCLTSTSHTVHTNINNIHGSNININNNNHNHNISNGHNNNNGINHNSNNNNSNNHSNNGKRKRSWSRAVFSNLQRKGLEIQFQQQKYITKPDRRKLAARLNLTDAQVKVWFQNRRMKWRHTRENLKSGQEKQPATIEVQSKVHEQLQTPGDMHHEMGYSTDGSDCSMIIDDNDDDGEIDVVE